ASLFLREYAGDSHRPGEISQDEVPKPANLRDDSFKVSLYLGVGEIGNCLKNQGIGGRDCIRRIGLSPPGSVCLRIQQGTFDSDSQRGGGLRFPCRRYAPGSAMDATARLGVAIPAFVRAAAPVASILAAESSLPFSSSSPGHWIRIRHHRPAAVPRDALGIIGRTVFRQPAHAVLPVAVFL